MCLKEVKQEKKRTIETRVRALHTHTQTRVAIDWVKNQQRHSHEMAQENWHFFTFPFSFAHCV